MTAAVLEIENLRTYFRTDDGTVKAVDDISLRLNSGRTLGIVGESGSGKSQLFITDQVVGADTSYSLPVKVVLGPDSPVQGQHVSRCS